ncbi:MFS quinate transporter QutD [Xylariaceae sp. FL1272]|nr:MFS quinate transporter QutD [Xylariaceae sp. FL1272]
MAGFRAIEDRPTPKEVYNLRLYFEALIIACVFGYDSAFVGTTIARKSFTDDFHITTATKNSVSSNITSAFQAAAFFGSIFCYLTTEKIGRKWALQINVLIFIVGAILMTVAHNQLSYIYAGRALTGLACGAITATVPSYIAELSISSIRGVLTGLFEVAYQLGSVTGFWINYGINENLDVTAPISWRLPMGFQLVPAVPLFIFGLLLHESPLWLTRKGKLEQACKTLEDLRRLHKEHEYIQEELQQIQGRLEEEAAIASRYGTGTWAFFRGALSELLQPGMRNRVMLVFWAFTLTQFSGAAAINYYSPTLFGSLGIEDVTLYTGIYGLLKAIASVVYYAFLIDLVGRRRPVLVSSIVCSLCLWFVGSYVKVANPAAKLAAGQTLDASTVAGGKAAIAFVNIYSVAWSFGLNGVPWVVSAEIFPGALRTITGTWASLVQWLFQFVLTKTLPYIFSSFGYGTWFFFASFMLIATAWAFFFLPETKGLTIDQMDHVFGYREAKSFMIPRTAVTKKLIETILIERQHAKLSKTNTKFHSTVAEHGVV